MRIEGEEKGVKTRKFRYAFRMRIGMGLDGGGTKTECVLMDDGGRVLGRGRGGPSNPSRIGIEAAVHGVTQAAEAALRDAGLTMEQVTDVCAGLAGVAAPERATVMSDLLAKFFASKNFELCTDLDLALEAAGAHPAIVLVAGTGSAAIGRNTAGRIARSGGLGPKKSDEGSAFAVGKSAVEVVSNAMTGGAADLRERILEQLGAETLDQAVGLTGEAADAVYPRVFPVIASAADEGNEIARNLLRHAAKSLAQLVGDVQEELNLSGTEFVLGKTGGMIGSSAFLDEILDAELRRIAPQATLQVLSTPLAEIAARRALKI